jgi:hypothetical protein
VHDARTAQPIGELSAPVPPRSDGLRGRWVRIAAGVSNTVASARTGTGSPGRGGCLFDEIGNLVSPSPALPRVITQSCSASGTERPHMDVRAG